MSQGTKTRIRREEPKLSRRQETLRVTTKLAQEAQKRAHQCFLSMIEGPVEPQVFVAKARYINPDVYNDVVVERAVAGLCGYPICGRTFTDTYGSRTYIIRANKLYDISDRRNFCSNVCYEASELVRKQIPTLPLYVRNTKDTDMNDLCLPDITKLKGRHGKQVDVTGGINKIGLDEDEKPSSPTGFVSVDDLARESLINWSEKENEENLNSNQKCTDGKETEQNVGDKDTLNTDETIAKGEENKAKKDVKESKKHYSVNDTKKNPLKNSLAEVLQVESVMRQWVSFDSLRMILGDLYVRGMLEHIGQSWDNYDTTSGMRLSVEAKARYIAICRKLEHDEKLEEEGHDKLDQDSKKQTVASKPLPNYHQLQRDAKAQQLKVVSFLGGNDQYEVEEEKLDVILEEETPSSTKNKATSKKPSEDSDTREPTLPFVDSYSQVAWRQNIVLEKVASYLQQMLEMTSLNVHEIQKLLGPLIATFHLGPDNISFHPKQWRLLTLILLKLLSVRYQIIQDSLSTQEGQSMQETILSAYALDLKYCDRVLSYLTEIQHILSKDFLSMDAKPENDCNVETIRETENR